MLLRGSLVGPSARSLPAAQDFYGGMYGHVPPMPLFNAYGQPMATFIPPHMPMYQPGTTEMLPASIQLRLDQLAATGFCHAGEIDDRYNMCMHVPKLLFC